MTKLVFTIALLNFFTAISYSQENFSLTVERKVSTGSCTMGYLIADGEVLAYTLELPWKDNKNDISCIPVGTYDGILRYDKTDGWRIQLDGVPGRTGVQIHMGNYTKQIEGCILVGTDAKVDGCTVTNSAAAYKKLKTAFYGTDSPASTPNKKITVSFK